MLLFGICYNLAVCVDKYIGIFGCKRGIFMIMTWFFQIIYALVVCLLCFCNASADDTLKYRIADYMFEVSSNEHKMEVRWSYPVFFAGRPEVTHALNAWIRDQSLAPLAECAEIPLSELRKMRDSQVQQVLIRSTQFAGCSLDQSQVEPAESFANFISFIQFTEWMGTSRPQHGITTLIFDIVSKRQIQAEKLFKPNALEDLNNALSEQISAERQECVRRFDWSQVTLRYPNAVIIHFPYNPAEWEKCGDGVEMIEGDLVKKLLNSRVHFPPQTKNDESPVKMHRVTLKIIPE